MNPEREIDVHLAEYQSLRSEMELYSQRIDRLTGFYVVALIGLFGFTVRPDSSFDLFGYANEVVASESRTITWCGISIVNSAILIRVSSLYFAILAIAQYTHFFIGRRLSFLVGGDVAYWDGPNSFSLKKSWLLMRGLSQTAFMLLASSASIGILIFARGAYSMSIFAASVYLIAVAFAIVALLSAVYVPVAGRKFQQPVKRE